MHETFLMVFTGILALAVVIQTILFFGMFRAIRQMSAALDGIGKDLLGHVSNVSAKVEEGIKTIQGLAEGFKPIRDKLTNTTDIIQNRVTELDAFVAEIAGAARLEVLRLQDIFQTAAEKVEETLEMMRKSLLAPFNEINAISRAIRVAMDIFFQRRKNPGSAHDEEMFI